MTVAEIGTMVFDGVTPDTDGDIFTHEETEGWVAVESELNTLDTVNDGDAVGNTRYTGRSYVFKGHAFCPYAGRHDRLMAKVAAASRFVKSTGQLKLRNQFLQSVTGGTPADRYGDLYAVVYRKSAPRWRRVGPFVVEFEIPFWSPSPYKYRTVVKVQALRWNGTGASQEQTITLDNKGQFFAPWTLEWWGKSGAQIDVKNSFDLNSILRMSNGSTYNIPPTEVSATTNGPWTANWQVDPTSWNMAYAPLKLSSIDRTLYDSGAILQPGSPHYEQLILSSWFNIPTGVSTLYVNDNRTPTASGSGEGAVARFSFREIFE